MIASFASGSARYLAASCLVICYLRSCRYPLVFEIGIMKSIGATNKDILTIFILNAALFGFVGGILGVLLGAIVSAMIPLMGLSIVGGGSMKAVFTVDLIFYGIALAMIIGTLSGLIPAIRASKLKPIDALRYE